MEHKQEISSTIKMRSTTIIVMGSNAKISFGWFGGGTSDFSSG